MGIYSGIDGAARKNKAIYAGVDGIARKVTKVYAGVDGVARLVWQESPAYKIYGVRIDETNPNPETAVEYTDDAIGMIPDTGQLMGTSGGGSKYAFGYATLGSRIYCMGGKTGTADTATVKTNYIYDVATNTWSTGAAMPLETASGSCATVGTKIYHFGGIILGHSAPTNVNQTYDTVANSWTQGAPLLPTARQGLSCITVGTKIYCIGGRSASSALNIVEIYDTATFTWSTGEAMPTARQSFSCAVIGTKIYCIGGWSAASTLLNIVEIYDTVTNTWSTGINMPTARQGLSCVAVGTKIYCIGGYAGTAALYTVESYDTATDTWARHSSLLYQRSWFGSIAVGNKIHCVGGYTGAGMTTAVDIFTSTNWDETPIFSGIRPCLLLNGIVQGYLNPSNFAQYEDGVTAADITSGNAGDVMIEFPKMAYMIYREGNYLYVKMTDAPNAKAIDSRFCYYAHTRETEGDRDYLYIGTFLMLNGQSRSGVQPDNNVSITALRNFLRSNKGSGYDLVSFYPFTLLQCLYLIRYKNLNSQTVLGMGYVGGAGKQSTGATNTSGMYYGSAATSSRVKFAGIEDMWGNLSIFIDGLYSDTSFNILTAFKDFNDTASGYTNHGQATSAAIYGFTNKAQGTSETGFILKENAGSSTTYYTDYGRTGGGSICTSGGGYSWGLSAGMFGHQIIHSATTYTADGGARLMYL